MDRHEVDKKSTRIINTDRHAELRRILEDRRRELSSELRRQIHDVRAIGPADLAQGVVDAEEASVSDIQEDIEIALMQMKSETLNRVNEALGPARGRHATGSATSAVTRSPSRACEPCPSPSAARTARRNASRPRRATSSTPAAAPPPRSWTSRADDRRCSRHPTADRPSSRCSMSAAARRFGRVSEPGGRASFQRAAVASSVRRQRQRQPLQRRHRLHVRDLARGDERPQLVAG